jgi:hypothetical protein
MNDYFPQKTFEVRERERRQREAFKAEEERIRKRQEEHNQAEWRHQLQNQKKP